MDDASRKKFKKGDELTLSIQSLSTEGKGIARTDEGFVVFVERTIPGDKVTARVLKSKKGFAEAKAVNIIEKSGDRIEPRCRHFGICGGCKLQNLSYQKQIEYKRENVVSALERIGGFENIHIPPVLGSDNIFYYRNKMEFSFSDDRWEERLQISDCRFQIEDTPPTPSQGGSERFALGLHVPGFHSKIIEVTECFLQSDVSADIVNFTRDFFKDKNISIYSTKTHSGFLRFLIIRQSGNTKDFMVNLITYDYDEELIKNYCSELISKFPLITTFVNSFTQKKAQVAFGDDSVILKGEGVIYEKINNGFRDLVFKISPNSFFQTNTMQAEKLYMTASDFGDFNIDDDVLDLYSGAGSIALFIADNVKSVRGVEIIDEAIQNAIENMNINGIENCEFVISDIKEFIEKESLSGYNKIILDPPRSGLHPEICEILSETNFERIVYVSCNPSTQARDLKIICGKGNYRIEKIQSVDMFPQTYHVENVVSLISN
jgi:23S rRNA (uracil1939-C5)-methyltransferase